ncbi:unnamed protein product, partial [Acidocella sp. C78]
VRGFFVPDIATRDAVGTAVLRPLAQEDAARFHQLINDWDICRRLPEAPFPYPLETAEAWVAAAVADRAAGRAHEFAIVDADGGMIGSAGLRLDAARAAPRWATGSAAVSGAAVMPGGRRRAAALGVRRAADLHDRGDGGRRQRSFDRAARRRRVQRDGPGPCEIHRPARREPAGGALCDHAGGAGAAPSCRPEPVAVAAAAKPLVLVAACALVDIEGRILLARRPPGKKMAGLWEFPGGKLAPGETPEQALVREMEEELGIRLREEDVAPFAFASHAYDQFHLLMPLYLARRWSGTPEPREGQALAWVPPDRLDEYPMPPADRPLLPLLRDFL